MDKEEAQKDTECIEQEDSGGARGSTGNFWRSYSAYTSGYQSVDHLSDIDEFEENFKYLSVVDKTRHYYTLCNAAPPVDTPPLPGTPVSFIFGNLIVSFGSPKSKLFIKTLFALVLLFSGFFYGYVKKRKSYMSIQWFMLVLPIIIHSRNS